MSELFLLWLQLPNNGYDNDSVHESKHQNESELITSK